MRRAILRIFGTIYIVAALIGFAPGSGQGWLSPNFTYNAFFLVLGFMALGVADIGSDHTEWFALIYAFVLLVLIIAGFVTYFTNSDATIYWGNALINMAALFAFVYVIIISHKKT